MREYEYTLIVNHDVGKYVAEVPELDLKIAGNDPNHVSGDIKVEISRLVEGQIISHEALTEGYIRISEYDRDNYENWNIPERGKSNVYFACAISKIEWSEWHSESVNTLSKLLSKYGKHIFYSFPPDSPYVMYMAHFPDKDAIQDFNTSVGYSIGLSEWQAISPSEYYDPYRMALWRDFTLTPLRYYSFVGETKEEKYYFVSDQVRAILNEQEADESLSNLCERLCKRDLASIEPVDLVENRYFDAILYLSALRSSNSTSDTAEKSCIQIKTEEHREEFRKLLLDKYQTN